MIKLLTLFSFFKKVENAPNFKYVNASISEIISNSTDNYVNTSIGNFKAKLIFQVYQKMTK